VKPLYILLAGALLLWLQPWSEATATPQFGKAEHAQKNASGRCKSGFRKSTTSGRCVRSGSRFMPFRWS